MGDTKKYRVKDIAAEWGFSVDTVQCMFVNEPGVFILPQPIQDTRKKPLRQPKKTLSIPGDVKDRVWRMNCNSRAQAI